MGKENLNPVKQNRKLRSALSVLAMVWAVVFLIGGVSMNGMEVNAEEAYVSWAAAGDAAISGIDYTETLNSDETTYTYTIYTAEGLAWVANQVNTYGNNFSGDIICLANDIDLMDAGISDYGTSFDADGMYNGSVSWTAIGGYTLNDYTSNPAKAFRGTFDGQGHTVSGVYINATSSHQGLFGYVYSGTIQNVGVIKSSITSTGGNIGGVVGYVSSGTVTNCYNTGDVSSSGNNVGGVVGNASNTTTVSNCYNAGDVSGSGSNVGGVVGSNYNGTVSISNCYNTGDVSGNDYLGGVLGYVSSASDNESTVNYCYSIGDVSGSGSNVGGVVGQQSILSNNVINYCYYNVDNITSTLSTPSYSGVTGLTTTEMTGTNASTNMSALNSADTTVWKFKGVATVDGATHYYYPILTTNEQDPAPSVSVEVPEFDTDLSTTPVSCTDATVATLSVSASLATDGVGELSYQWYSSTDNINWEEISSDTDAKVGTLASYTPSIIYGTTYYKVIVTNTVTIDENQIFTPVAKSSSVAEITIITAELAEALGKVEKMTYDDVSQGTAYDTAEELAAYIAGVVAEEVNNSDITVSVSGTYTPAIAGTSADEEGTDGTYTFTITLTDKEGCTRTYSGAIDIIAEQYVDDSQDNEVEYEVSGNGDVTIDEDTFEQLKNELFSVEELASDVEKKVVVKVDVVAVEDMDEETQGEFDTYLDEYNSGLEDDSTAVQALVFDISVIRMLAGVEESITELDTPITITIAITEEYQADGREFFILRNHNGEITVLIDLDDDPTTITFSTDCFSNYTLNYIDVETEADTEVTPDTGDTNNVWLLWTMMGISTMGVIIIGKKKLVGKN